MPSASVQPQKYLSPTDAVRVVIDELPNGKFAVRGVPIFQVHDERGFDFDSAWMRGAVARQRENASRGFLPRIIIGHNDEGETPREKPVVGYLDNYRFDEDSGLLYADFVDVPEPIKKQIEVGMWPGRSVEVFPDDNEINVLALLGGSEPYFKFPDLRFESEKRKKLWVHYTKGKDMSKPKKFQEGADGQPTETAAPEAVASAFSPEQKAEIVEIFKQLVAEMNARAGNTNESFEDDKNGDDPMKSEKPGDPVKYEALQSELAESRRKISELELRNEKQELRQLFSNASISRNVLDIDKEVEFAVSLPAGKRIEYARRIVSMHREASTRPVSTADHVHSHGDQTAAINEEWAKPEVKRKYGYDYAKFLSETGKQYSTTKG